MKLRAKFILGFVILALLIAVMAGIYLDVSRNVTRKFKSVVYETVPSVIALGQIKAVLLKTQTDMLGNILVDNYSEVFKLANERKKKWEAGYFEERQDTETRQFVEEVNRTEKAVYQLGLELMEAKKPGALTGMKLKKGELEMASNALILVLDNAMEVQTLRLREQNKLAQAGADRAFKITILVFLLILVTAVVIGLVLGNSVVTPIQKLKEVAEKIGKGDLSAKVKIKSHDEIGALAESFDRMAANLDRSHKGLKLAVEQAERANRLKGDFLRNTSHELKTPMTIVLGMADLLLDSDIKEEEKKYVRSIKESGEGLLRLINDLLDYSKAQAGQLKLSAQPFNLKDESHKLIDFLSIQAREKHIVLNLDYDSNAPVQVIGDSRRLNQLLSILISNAIKFTEKGSVILSVQCEKKELKQAVFLISVKDTGIGISKENLPYVFEHLSQLDGSKTRRFGGIGIGLSIFQQLATLMGGQFGVESEMGKGSRFWLRLMLPLV